MDARAYLATTRRRFDVILEDIFVGSARAMRALFPATLRIDIEDYDNRIVVGGPGVVSARALRAAAAAHPMLHAVLGCLSFRTLGR